MSIFFASLFWFALSDFWRMVLNVSVWALASRYIDPLRVFLDAVISKIILWALVVYCNAEECLPFRINLFYISHAPRSRKDAFSILSCYHKNHQCNTCLKLCSHKVWAWMKHASLGNTWKTDHIRDFRWCITQIMISMCFLINATLQGSFYLNQMKHVKDGDWKWEWWNIFLVKIWAVEEIQQQISAIGGLWNC